jgi:hypothetical protein
LYGDSLDQFIAITDKPFVQFATCSFSHWQPNDWAHMDLDPM